ncbi:MAG: hypothetical protein H8E27_01625 [Verrucomicrobia subdivision 3 bacterium]|nr:hypothetical protein [Limisphaerales bacterium]
MAIDPKYIDTIRLSMNHERRPDKSDPHFKGNGNFGELEFWADAWVNSTKEGEKWIRVKLKAKDARPWSKQLKESLGDPLDGVGDVPTHPATTIPNSAPAESEGVPF